MHITYDTDGCLIRNGIRIEPEPYDPNWINKFIEDRAIAKKKTEEWIKNNKVVFGGSI